MINYKEILRLKSLGFNNSQIAYSCNCARATVITILKRAEESNLTWEKIRDSSNEELSQRFFSQNVDRTSYQKPGFEYIYFEMAKSGVTLSLLWLE